MSAPRLRLPPLMDVDEARVLAVLAVTAVVGAVPVVAVEDPAAAAAAVVAVVAVVVVVAVAPVAVVVEVLTEEEGAPACVGVSACWAANAHLRWPTHITHVMR